MKSWDSIRYYLAVARQGTVSGAATELAVTHATVLRRIDQFEQDLGLKLFRRHSLGYDLTDAGATLFERALSIEAEMRMMEAEARGNDDSSSGRIRVTQPPLGAIDFYDVYVDFRHQHPKIGLEIIPGPWLHNLNSQEVDVSIVFCEQPDELLVGRELGQIKFNACASESYLARFTQQPALGDIEWVLQDKSTAEQSRGGKQTPRRFLEQQLGQPRIAMETSSYSDVVAAVKAGLGAGFLSHLALAADPNLTALDCCHYGPERPLWILTHRDLRSVPRIQTFVRFVAERLTTRLARGTNNRAMERKA